MIYHHLIHDDDDDDETLMARSCVMILMHKSQSQLRIPFSPSFTFTLTTSPFELLAKKKNGFQRKFRKSHLLRKPFSHMMQVVFLTRYKITK